MKAAVYSQKTDKDTFHYITRIIDELKANDVEPILHQPMAETFPFEEDFATFSHRDDLQQNRPDMFFSFGGDGTILNALTFIKDLEIPVVGVNTGRLGFLASFGKEEIFGRIGRLIRQETAYLSRRTVLEVKTGGTPLVFPYALNDVSITRKETTAMITIDSYIDDEFLTVFWADGVIVSTPTGSTAYSLSCGGPIIAPTSDNLCLTPIAPHNLNVRPLIVKEDVRIRLKVQSRVPQYSLSLDSRLYHMNTEDELLIEKAPFSLLLVQPADISFFETIRQKLLWGRDKRN